MCSSDLDWSSKAIAFAFKCGPPEGHHTEPLLKQFPDWRLSSGHAHPDANSFIIFAGGQYLTGDSGYAGLPMTEHHNTLLIDGKGQGKEGDGHDVFGEVPYELLNGIRITYVKASGDEVVVTGDATAAYLPVLGLKKFVRQFVYKPGDGFTILDEVETTKPSVLSWLLHADDSINKVSENQFSIVAGGVKLIVRAEIEVSDGAAKQFRGTIETNTVTAPGPPGAVDKGEQQARGVKLVLSTAGPVTRARFREQLSIEGLNH